MINLSQKAFISRYRVYFEDTDAGGVVYHANYLRFMERARSDWLASVGCLPQQPKDQWGVIFAVRSVNLEFFKPARLGDLLRVTVEPDSVRGASIAVSQTIANEADVILVQAKFLIACMNYSEFRVQRMPEDLRRMLS